MDSDRWVEACRGELFLLLDRVSRSGLELVEELELLWLGVGRGCWEERAREDRRGLIVTIDEGFDLLIYVEYERPIEHNQD